MRKRLIECDFLPTISTYWFWADQFLMIRDVEDNNNWLINNFIEIKYNPEGLPRDVYFCNAPVRNKMVEFYNCPFLNMQKIDIDSNCLIGNLNVIDFIIHNIKSGKYVLLMANRRYISSYNFTKDDLHQLLIYGFDDVAEEVYYADNNRIGKYSIQMKCSFDEIKMAFSKTFFFSDEPDISKSVFTFEPYKMQDYPIDIRKIKKSLINYYSNDTCSEVGNKGGILVYVDLASYYKDKLEKGEQISYDIRGIHTLLDHARAMKERLHLLKEEYGVLEEWIDSYQHIEKQLKKVILLMVKYKITLNTDIVYDVINVLNEVYNSEKELLHGIITSWESIEG